MSKILFEKHVQIAQRKQEAIEGKEALLRTVLQSENLDVRYLAALRRRIWRLKVQYANFKPLAGE